MKQCLDKFFADRNYAISWMLFGGVLVTLFLSLFLLLKVVDQIIVWNDSGEYATNTITVSGTGEVVAVPDIATFTYSVDVTSESVESAQEEAAQKTNVVLEFLKENEVDEKDIKTVSYNVSPRYEFIPCRPLTGNCQTERNLIGYQVNQSVMVKVRDTDKAGEILSGIGSRGITNVSGLNFSIDDPDSLKAEARSEAVKNAREKAEILAKDLGVKIKKVVSFNEDQGFYPMMMESRAGIGGDVMESALVSPELPRGENTITTTVSVTYEIK